MAKKIIKILVRDKVATLEDKSVRLKGGNNDYKIVFDFDEDWNAYEMKTAVFVFGEDSIKKTFYGNEVDGEAIYGANMCVVGVFAGDIITTSGALIPCEYSVLDVGGKPKPPTPNEYNQIMLQFNRYVSLLKGGSANQVLRKKSDSDFDFEWGEGNGGQSVIVDQDYNPQSKNAVSGTALAPIFDKMNESIHSHEIRLENLEKGLSPSRFLTDDSVAHTKIAPERACPYAQLNYIGGRSVKKTVAGDDVIAEDNSIYTHRWDGYIGDANIYYINLTPGIYHITFIADERIKVGYRNMDYTPDRTYLEGAENDIEVTTESAGEYEFFIDGDITTGDYPYSFKISTPKSVIEQVKPTAIKVKTPNILPFPYTSANKGREIMDVGFKTTLSSAEWEVKEDGSFVINGILSGTPSMVLSKDYLTFDKDVFVSGCPEGGNTQKYYITIYSTASSSTIFGYDAGSGKLIPAGTPFKLAIGVAKGTVCDNLTFRPMVTYGNIKQPYSPPNEAPTIYEIPESIQSIEGYGEGNPEDASEFNYIDCENQKFVAKGKMVDGAWVRNEPAIETPITFDKIIEVKGASPIEFVNEQNAPVPSSISYMLREE